MGTIFKMSWFLLPTWSQKLLVLIWISQQETLGQSWGVKYGLQNICALQGTSVDLPCEFSHPQGLQITQTYWFNDPATRSDISSMERFRDRVHYLGDKVHNCSLKLSSLTTADTGHFRFRIITNVTGQKWAGEPGVRVNVAGLQVSGPTIALIGERVVFQCSTTTCKPQANMTYKWTKNRVALSIDTNQLILGQVGISDEAEYACFAQGNKAISSPAVKLSVEHAPQNTKVFLSPSGDILEGFKVILTCSSEGRPSVKNYTWYRRTEAIVSQIGVGQNYTLKEVAPSDRGQYFCMSTNKHGGLNSTTTSLYIQYPPKKTSVSVFPTGDTLEGLNLTLKCTSDGRPFVKNYTWYRKTETNIVRRGVGQNYSLNNATPNDSGQYFCLSINKHGSQNSSTRSLYIHYPPKKTSVSMSPSGDTLEGVNVTLKCSSEGHPPVKSYTWYRKAGANASRIGQGSMYTFRNVTTNDSGRYFCMAANKHGGQNSALTFVDVLYPPRHTSILALPDLVEGYEGLFSLRCSSDANPKVENYTWFKVNVAPPVGWDQNYSTEESGWYYCMAWNKLGMQRSVPFHINGRRLLSSLLMLILIIAGLSCLCITVIVAVSCALKRRRIAQHKNQQAGEKDADTYMTLHLKSLSSEYETLPRAKENDYADHVCEPTYENFRLVLRKLVPMRALKLCMRTSGNHEGPEAVYDSLGQMEM